MKIGKKEERKKNSRFKSRFQSPITCVKVFLLFEILHKRSGFGQLLHHGSILRYHSNAEVVESLSQDFCLVKFLSITCMKFLLAKGSTYFLVL